MASFFTRALDTLTPWNRGGEVKRRQISRKKKDEEEARRKTSAPSTPKGPTQLQFQSQSDSLDQPLRTNQPTNIFQDLNKTLTFGQNKPGVVPVFNNASTVPAQTPKPGTVVKPRTPEDDVNDGLNAGKSWQQIANETNVPLESVKQYSQATRPSYGIKVAKPKQSFGNKFRDIFDANTEADKYRRAQGNANTKLQPGQQEKPITLENPGNIVSRTPVVGPTVKLINTAGRQIPQAGITIQQQLATAEYSAATEELTKATKSGDKKRIAQAKTRADKAANRVKDINRQLDAADTTFEKNKGGLFNAGTLYDEEAAKKGDIKTGLKDIAAPTAVAALDLYTLGKGSAISDAIAQNGLRTGVKVAAPNIGKAAVGNFASGGLNTYSEGGNTDQAVKAGILSSILGLVPDIGLPAAYKGLRNRVAPRVFTGRSVNPADVAQELDDAGLSASAQAAYESLRPKPIRVRQPVNIPVRVEGGLEPISVRTTPSATPVPIREVSGDFSLPNADQLRQTRIAEAGRAADEFNAAAARPDPLVEGVVPRTTEPYKVSPVAVKNSEDELIDQYATFLKDVGEGNGVAITADGRRVSNNMRFGNTGGKRMTKADWREEAERQLRAGKAEPELQKAFDEAANPEVQSLLARGNQTEEPPIGRPIDVRQVNTIPVTDQTVIPTGLPETPGTVRTTANTAPANVEAAQVAAQTPVALPREVQEILNNPKQFNKRQVAAARNQRKLARQMAKTQEQTAEALDRIETASPAAQSGEGFVSTGEFGRSAQGGAYQKTNRAAEMQHALQETSQMSNADVLQTARKNQLETGGFNRRDIRNVAALFESKRLPRGSTEWNEARQILKEDGTVWGQTGALRNYTMRRTASADELMNRYESKIYRLADDPTKIDSKWFDEVEAVENTYTQARDDALTAYNRFTEAPTNANAKAYHAAQDAAEKADKAAKITEYKVADKVLKGNKDIKQVRELEKMANDADMYQMDAVDASMLSGTGTFTRNFVNAVVGGVEEGVFGRPAAFLSRKFTGESVGGGIGKGTIKGFTGGVRNIVDASSARASNAGKNPFTHIKNWATTGNQLGDIVIDSQTTRNVFAHYKHLLKEEGYAGRELRDRASVMARQDPEDVGRMYATAARTAAGLGGGITRNNKIETIVKNMVSDAISFGAPNAASEATAKLITRMTIGFPTAIGRSTAEGVKRFTLGTPTFIRAIVTKDPAQRALLIKEGIKQAGTGSMVVPPLFYALGANGMITGAYPTDPEERARWEREGITEHSIKIGGAYYQLPSYLGAWAVPGLFYASLGRNGGDFGAAATDTAKSVPAILPTDQMSNWLDVINGRTDPGKFAAQTGASAVRAATPGGALLNQLAKSFDPTKNDTNTNDSNVANFVDKVLSGIPGASNTLPNKEDDAGNVIQNPKPGELLLGAASAVQGKGEERSAQIRADVNSGLQKVADTGALDDPNLKSVLDDKTLQIYNKLKSGKEVSQDDLKKLQDGLVKGVSQTGDDTAYLEREQYDSNLSALRLKKQLMEADKSVKPSDIEKVDIAIKRGEIYKDQEIPYDMIDAYKSTSLTDWRKMGDPEDDSYDADMYQKLWAIDELLTKAGVSYKKGALDKQKYSAKKPGKGRSGSGSRGGSRGGVKQLDTSFGTLKDAIFSPRVQQYDTIDAKSGSVPIIRTVRPNIVHKITSG